jgi:phosphonopyruvate decarboxylase
MIRGADFLAAARAAGFDTFAGVPCSYLTPLMNAALDDAALGYLSATNEGEAVAIAAGAWLAGRRPMVMMQNSGLGNAVSPLTSLIAPCRIGVLAIVTWRGQPGVPDEPQHAVMGAITPALLALIGVAHEPFSMGGIARAAEAVAAGRGYALVLARGAVADEPLREVAASHPIPGRVIELREVAAPPPRIAALEHVLAHAPPDAAIVSTTGKCSRELFTLADRPAHFYLVGAMGCASAVGWPPVESCTPLSRTTWISRGGAALPIVTRVSSRMSSPPSPSITTTGPGLWRATPRPTALAQPIAPTR